MKKRSIRFLRTAAKSDHGLKKVGRSRPRAGPDELVDMPLEKITSMKSLTKSNRIRGVGREDNVTRSSSEDPEEDYGGMDIEDSAGEDIVDQVDQIIDQKRKVGKAQRYRDIRPAILYLDV